MTGTDASRIPVVVSLRFGDWLVEETWALTFEQRANMRDDVLADIVRRMTERVFEDFQSRHIS